MPRIRLAFLAGKVSHVSDPIQDDENYTLQNRKITSRAGLLVPATLLERLGLGAMVDRLMPAPGSNRGYQPSRVFHTFMLMLHEGAKRWDDVRHLRKDQGLKKLLGFPSFPCSSTLGNWLRSVGKHRVSRNVLPEINRRLLQVSLDDRTRVTVDIDASAIHAHKKTTKRTCKGRRGFLPMFGHIAQTGQVLYAELRRGNVPPAARNLEFFKRCIEALPEGVRVNRFRADAATYQAHIINFCRTLNIRFAIRAKMSKNVRELIAGIPESDWQPVVYEHGQISETEFLARTLHAMDKTPEAFCLVVQKPKVAKPSKSNDPDTPPQPEQMEIEMQEQSLNPVDGESALKDGYIYRAIATDLDLEGFSNQEMVWWYNQRADASENRIKELRSDFSGAQLPGGTFRANAVYLYLNVIAYNLLALVRMSLGTEWYGCRANTIRSRLYDMAGLVVRHARQWTLKVNSVDLKLLDETLWMIRTCRLF